MINTMTVIETKNLTKSYKDVTALDSLTLAVERGGIFGLLGHNGAGKTTAVSILTTLINPTSGTASICGFDTQTDRIEVQKHIGYLPENVKFYDNLTAYENLEYLAKLSGVKNIRSKIYETR